MFQLWLSHFSDNVVHRFTLLVDHALLPEEQSSGPFFFARTLKSFKLQNVFFAAFEAQPGGGFKQFSPACGHTDKHADVHSTPLHVFILVHSTGSLMISSTWGAVGVAVGAGVGAEEGAGVCSGVGAGVVAVVGCTVGAAVGAAGGAAGGAAVGAVLETGAGTGVGVAVGVTVGAVVGVSVWVGFFVGAAEHDLNLSAPTFIHRHPADWHIPFLTISQHRLQHGDVHSGGAGVGAAVGAGTTVGAKWGVLSGAPVDVDVVEVDVDVVEVDVDVVEVEVVGRAENDEFFPAASFSA